MVFYSICAILAVFMFTIIMLAKRQERQEAEKAAKKQ
jgi:hypothetical protein